MTVGSKVRYGSQSKKIETTEDRPSDKTVPICITIALHISCPSVVISYKERVFWPLDHLDLGAREVDPRFIVRVQRSETSLLAHLAIGPLQQVAV